MDTCQSRFLSPQTCMQSTASTVSCGIQQTRLPTNTIDNICTFLLATDASLLQIPVWCLDVWRMRTTYTNTQTQYIQVR